MKRINPSVLITKYGNWGSYEKFPDYDWQYEVANGVTRLGYWDWVSIKLSLAGCVKNRNA